MSNIDKTLTCRDCQKDFVFTAAEQDFYAEKGFTVEPTRCPSCRDQRKSGAAGRSSGGYRDSYGGDRDRPSSTPRQSRGPTEMHRTTCASCGREALVPFVPPPDKPCYCSDCLQQHRPAPSRGARW